MKKMLAAAVIAASVTAAHAQEERGNVITTNGLGVLIGSLNAEYEFLLNQSAGISIGGNYWSFTIGDFTLRTTGFGVAYLLHPGAEWAKGFYFGPRVGVTMVTGENTSGGTTQSNTTTFFNVGADIGYRWIWDKGVVFGLGVGAGYSIGELKVGDEKVNYGGVGLSRASVDLGYAF